MSKYAVYIGRFQPFHIGHESIIKEMLKRYDLDNVLIFVGSSNSVLENNIFSFYERYKMIKNNFSELKNILPLADINNDDEWLFQLDLLLKFWKPNSKESDFTFYCGLQDDVWFLDSKNYKTKIVDRNIIVISGTQIREALKIRNFDLVKNSVSEQTYKVILKRIKDLENV